MNVSQFVTLVERLSISRAYKAFSCPLQKEKTTSDRKLDPHLICVAMLHIPYYSPPLSQYLPDSNISLGMCCCVDMANHASGNATAALYETDNNGNGLLLLRAGKQISQGSEITIT